MANPTTNPVKTAVENDRIGFYGKLPSHGDFVSEGLDRELVGAFDNWLQTGMHACADVFADRWSAVFSNSPPLRFIIERGIWGRSAYAGVLLPSKDRVGRKFPLIVLAQLNDFRQHPRTLYLDDTWFMAAEALAETSMAADFEMPRFTSSIKRLRLPKPRGEEDELHVSTGNPTSLWWYIDAESRRPRGMKFQGKPAATDFVKLFRDQTEPEKPASPQKTDTPPRASENRSGLKLASEETATKTPPVTAKAPERAAIVYSYATHAGTRLATNADALFVSRDPALFAIADGVGDATSAVEAARLTTNAFTEIGDSERAETILQDIKGKLGTVNSLLFSRQFATELSRPMASVVAASVVGETMSVIWSGDARAYLLRDGTMHPLTRDHVSVGMKRQLSQCVGISQQFRPSAVTDQWKPDDRLLLCSYPLLQALQERTVAEILHDTPVNDCANALMQEALIENARENISAIVIGSRIG